LNSISLQAASSLDDAMNAGYEVYFTYDCATDERGRDTHQRMSQLSQSLRKLGVRTHFTDERTRGEISDSLTAALKKCELIVIGITDGYRQRIEKNREETEFSFSSSTTTADLCSFEYSYIVQSRMADVEVIVLEEQMKDPLSSWGPVLQRDLGSCMVMELTADEKRYWDRQCEELASRIKARLEMNKILLSSDSNSNFAFSRQTSSSRFPAIKSPRQQFQSSAEITPRLFSKRSVIIVFIFCILMGNIFFC
jgi:hypothetical protein